MLFEFDFTVLFDLFKPGQAKHMSSKARDDVVISITVHIIGIHMRAAFAEFRLRPHLIANAQRYTPRGGTIEIAAALAPDPSAVRIAVTDSGPGIPSDVLPHVFERFVKSPESRGSGLGLAIARNLVVSHGGQIGVDSAPGRGTKVWFTLPVGDQPER